MGRNDLSTDEKEGDWIVVFEQKSSFTRAVLDVFTRNKAALESGRPEELKVAFNDPGDVELGKLADALYGVLHE